MLKNFFKSKFVHSYRHDYYAISGSLILVAFIFIALSAPMIAPQNPYDMNTVDLDDFLKPPVWMDGGSSDFLLGTDDQGRGILSTILFGCRTSLVVAFSVVGICSVIGVTLGLLAGYYGGLLDSVLMRIADAVFSFSSTLIAFLFLGVFKQSGVLILICAICIANWVRYARTMRGSVLEVKKETFVLAAKASGIKDGRLLFLHILPNAISPIFVVAAVDMAIMILLEASLSFLGVGVPVNEPSLGMLIANGKDFVYAGMWWLVVFPSAALVLIVLGVNLFADWLREELNPKLER